MGPFGCDNPDHDHSEDDNPVAFVFAQHRAEEERMRAASEVTGHEVSSALKDMSKDQLLAVRHIVSSVTSAQNPALMAGYFLGRISTLLDSKFGVCPTCNTKHDDISELVQVNPDIPEHVQSRRKLDEASSEIISEDGMIVWTPIGSTSELKPFEINQMKLYGLDDLRDRDTGELMGFVCLNCGQRYPTLVDRQLESPGVEGCSGCQQKAKFG